MDQSAFNCSLQSRSPLASPKIRDSAVPIFVAIGILYWSQVRIILYRRIVKENYHIHIAAFNHLGKLFVSAYASRQKLVYMKVRHLFNPPSGGSGGVHLMFHEDSLVCNTEILDQTLLAVVCYDSNIHYCKPPLLLFLLPCTAIITNLFSIRNSFCEFFTQFLYFFLPFHFSFFFYFLRFSGKNTESGSLFLFSFHIL